MPLLANKVTVKSIYHSLNRLQQILKAWTTLLNMTSESTTVNTTPQTVINTVNFLQIFRLVRPNHVIARNAQLGAPAVKVSVQYRYPMTFHLFDKV